MNKFLMLFFVLFVSTSVYAGSVNPAVYKTMSTSTYRTNYNRNAHRNMPYWQVQSNYATRNRSYQDYYNYSRHMNNAVQTNYGNQFYRGRF